MKICLESIKTNTTRYCYFYIIYNKSVYNTSKRIAKLLNINVDEYNMKLITKVICNSEYKINDDGHSVSSRDLNFIAESISPEEKKVYVEKFKKAFIKELSLLRIGGKE